jgi:hypothetical protein
MISVTISYPLSDRSHRGRTREGQRERGTVIQVSAPHFVAGIVMENGCATRPAPIVNYMLGWTRERIERYCPGKRWRVEEC